MYWILLKAFEQWMGPAMEQRFTQYMGKFTQYMGKYTQSLHILCNDDRVNTQYGQRFTQYMGKFTQFLHIWCNDSANIKMQQKVTHMHRYHASNVIKTRTMNLFW